MEGTLPNDIERLEVKIDQVITLLTGDGNPERGFIVRIDRVEREVKSICDSIKTFYRILWSFAFMFLVFLASVAYGLLTHKIEIVFK